MIDQTDLEKQFVILRDTIIEKRYEKLNEMQKNAVLSGEGPILILAGAGSGKTTVMVHRIYHLIKFGNTYKSEYVPNGIMEQDIVLMNNYLRDKKKSFDLIYPERISQLLEISDISPDRILAVTFTNKAAKEMKERVSALLSLHTENIWISTFHSICARILRRDIDKIGYTKNFTIYDDSDQMAVINQCLKEMNLSEKYYPAREVKTKISQAKDKIVSPEKMLKESNNDFRMKKIVELYKMYEKKMKDSNALDFDDLIIKTLKLFDLRPDILDFYRRKFKYIHVDEYQDTNYSQYKLVKLLSDYHKNICVVGDDDQSIYGWRGADIRNILEFEKDYTNTKIIKLEQNYRSTQNILSAANHVIKNNNSRKEKRLWTDHESGPRVEIYKSNSEHDEANFVLQEISTLKNLEKRNYSDFAVLYRINAQSRVLEEMCMKYGIPYRIYGGQRFYNRKEIKDILAYLRVIVNPLDEISLKRIINTPKRGIGDTTVDHLEMVAKACDDTIFGVILSIENAENIPSRIVKKIMQFSNIMKRLMAAKESLNIKEFIELLINETDYLKQYESKSDAESESRVENIREFTGAVQEYMDSYPEPTLENFLENVALVSDVETTNSEQQGIMLMTLHSAKGLEFPFVFLTGMEERIFPHARALTNEDEMEEERRLCYVGITRAKEKLYLTYSLQRSLFGMTSYNSPSRFINEIPDQYKSYKNDIHELNPQTDHVNSTHAISNYKSKINVSNTTNLIEIKDPNTTDQKIRNEKNISLGSKVEHDKFGIGTVIDIKGEGKDCIMKIAFPEKGIKEISIAYANIKPC